MIDAVWIASVLAGFYLLGSASSAHLVTYRLAGIDVREVGSRNAGALNVYRTVGLLPSLLVFAMDVAKGMAAVALPEWSGLPDWVSFGVPFALMAGHNWPATLGFRGGRGLAPVIGVSLAMLPELTIAVLAIAVILIAAFRNVVLAAIVGLLVLNVSILAIGQSQTVVLVCGGLSLIVVVTHVARTWRLYLKAVQGRLWAQALKVE